MGLATFRQGSSNSSGAGILYRMKPLTLPSQLYGVGSTNTAPIPVYRSGAPDKSFEATASTGITLYTTAATGSRSSTAVITYNTYLASSAPIAFHLNSADTCLYVLLSGGGSLQLIKINDTTGVVTSIGSPFTPTTLANWSGLMTTDVATGHLKIIGNGTYHLVNRTTGAIVSQNTAISLGPYLARNVFYVTQDGSVGVSTDTGVQNQLAGVFYFPNIVSSSFGHVGGFSLPFAAVNAVAVSNTPTLLRQDAITLVDSDKVCISLSFSGGSSPNTSRYYLLTEFDKFIKSVADAGTGVI